MNGQRGGRFHLQGTGTVVIAGGAAVDRDELRQRLEAAGLSVPIETTGDAAAAALEKSAPVGVVRLVTADTDGVHRDSEELPELADGNSLIVLGSGADVAAAYEAGASQVIPLAVADLPDAAVDRMVEHFRQTQVGRIVVDLLAHAPAGVTVNDPETGEILGYTDRCATLLGHDRSTDGFGVSDLAACSDHTDSGFAALIREAAESGDATVDLRDLPDEAPADRLEVTFEPVTIAGERFVVGWIRDITERTRRIEELQRYETILESLDDAVYAMAPDGTIEYVNEKYVSMKGVDREALLGTNLYEWVDEGPAERAKEIRRQLRSGEREVGRLEYEFRSAAGETTPAEIRFVTMPGDSEAVGGAGVIRDISDQRAYEQQLERQNERLEEFASVVSHDLRNPLSVASGRLELAREECDSEHLDAVDDAHDRMAELIDDLLTLAREGDDVRDIEPVDLASLVENCWANVETGNATVDVDVDRPVRADPSRLRQLVENLIRNAVEHVGDDVAITVGTLDDDSGFYIADDGPGIPPERRESVFEAGESTDPDGTGFGLSIVKQVAEAHGWDVRLTDATGGGARFEFSGVAFDAE